MMRLPTLLLILSFGATSARPDEPSFWRFSAGAVSRQIGGLDWHSGTRSADFLLPGLGADFNTVGAAGPASGAASRSYQNGYVNPDPNTSITGSTWFWGYEADSQLQGNSLIFQGGGGTIVQTEFTSTSGDWTEGNLDGFGPTLQAEWITRLNAEWSWSVLGSFFFTQFDAEHSGSTFSATHMSQVQSVTDSYDLGGLLPPAGPYHGDFAGPGPTLPVSPSSRSYHNVSEENDRYRNVIRQAFELQLLTFSLGPTVEWHRGRWGVQASAGLAINVARWEAEQQERLLRNGEEIQSWLDRETETEALFGGFVQLAAHRSFDHDWHVSAFVRYDWSQGIEASVGPSTVEVDLDSFTAGLMIGKTF
ncbi:MAG: hypothetical protein JNM99_10785 [Verrucomicrobiaceae bacterium]|nr:hypothetical protein [Verrucomicrobiaceae bacterium]